MDKVADARLSRQVYEIIKTMILNHELKPGERIEQQKMAENLGVSRTPLIRALAQLESELLVEIIPHRGVYVKDFGSKELLDLYDIREALEGIAAREAATSLSGKQIEQLRHLFDGVKRAPDKKKIAFYIKADQRFHTMIMDACKNRILHQIYKNLHILTRSYRKGLIRPPELSLGDHMEIIDAFVKRDGEPAGRLMRLHIKKSRDIIRQHLKDKVSGKTLSESIKIVREVAGLIDKSVGVTEDRGHGLQKENAD